MMFHIYIGFNHHNSIVFHHHLHHLHHHHNSMYSTTITTNTTTTTAAAATTTTATTILLFFTTATTTFLLFSTTTTTTTTTTTILLFSTTTTATTTILLFSTTTTTTILLFSTTTTTTTTFLLFYDRIGNHIKRDTGESVPFEFGILLLTLHFCLSRSAHFYKKKSAISWFTPTQETQNSCVGSRPRRLSTLVVNLSGTPCQNYKILMPVIFNSFYDHVSSSKEHFTFLSSLNLLPRTSTSVSSRDSHSRTDTRISSDSF